MSERRTNIVFIFADQHRWDFMGYETNGVTHTPTARLRSVRPRGMRSPRDAMA